MTWLAVSNAALATRKWEIFGSVLLETFFNRESMVCREACRGVSFSPFMFCAFSGRIKKRDAVGCKGNEFFVINFLQNLLR